MATLAELDDTALLRKVDWRIVPLLFLCYLFQLIDKIAINYSNVMGIQKDLGMSGNDFSWTATSFFLAFVLSEFPQALLLQRFRVNLVLGVNIILWGVLCCCTAAVQNFAALVAVRTLLGACEGAIVPSLVLVTNQWYKRREASLRYGIWYSGACLGQSFGGLMSFAFQNVQDKSFSSWRAMFITFGGMSLILGLSVILALPSSPERAPFLTTDEKSTILSRCAENRFGPNEKQFRPNQFSEALTDPAVWLLTLTVTVSALPLGAITTFSSVIISGFGYTSKQSALLNIASGPISAFAILFATWTIRKGIRHWQAMLMIVTPTIIGGGLMGFLPAHNRAGLLAGIYLINFANAPPTIIFYWCGINCAGYTKRLTANAMVSAGFGLANIIGPLTFQARDKAGGYIPAKVAILAAESAAALLTVGLAAMLARRNRRRRGKGEDEGVMVGGDEDVNITDRQNRRFVYMY